MKCIVGIGNYGSRYTHTRHNVGFEVLDIILKGEPKKLALKWKKRDDLKAMIAPVSDEILLVKPLTFVNNTGEALAALLEEFSANHKDFLLVCDDVNLELGRLRFRAKGSAGGHHGLESVIEAWDSQDFLRLRIGVKNESMPQELAGFVLQKFETDEKERIEKTLNQAAQACNHWAKQGEKAAMNYLSRLPNLPDL